MRVEIEGTAQFRQLAKDLKAAGRGDLRKEMAKALREGAKPVVEKMQRNVEGIATTGARGGASARAARAAKRLGKRKAGDKAKLRAHRSSGLRAAAARTVKAKVTTGGKSASVRIKSDAKTMPWGQKSLPGLMNDGKWRHPVFANRDVWVTQTVNPAGWFDRPAQQSGPKVRDNAIETVAEFVEKLA